MNIDPQITRDASTARSVVPAPDIANERASASAIASESTRHERWTKLPKSRGRQPKDPHAQSIRFPCRDIDDLEKQLRGYLQAPTAPAEHATLEFTYPVSSAFSVYAADIRGKRSTQQDEKTQHLYGKLERSAISVIDALAQTIDPKDQMRRQKAIAKVCVEACERADGFRYSFHNNWLSHEDEACRFSYFCNDSTLNKGRAANEGAHTAGKKMRKAVYDCQGLIAIKFSLVKQSLEVHYKHIPLHKTYAERAPPPRKDSKRYKLMEIFEPEKLPPEHSRRPKTQASEESAPRRSRKRRATDTPVHQGDIPGRSVAPPDAGLGDIVGTIGLVASQLNTSVNEYVEQYNRSQTEREMQFPSASKPTQQQKAKPNPLAAARAAPAVSSARTTAPLTWVDPNEVSAISRSRRQMTGNENTSSMAEPSPITSEPHSVSAISVADFEALKAKLEAAEQRIKNLEAEKQTVPPNAQTSWGRYPALPPSSGPQYPFGYHPPPLPYAQTPAMPADYQPLPSAASHPQQPISTPGPGIISPSSDPKDVNSRTAGSTATKQSQPPISKTSSVRAFVPYTPRPQRPILDAQRQDAIRSSANGSGRG